LNPAKRRHVCAGQIKAAGGEPADSFIVPRTLTCLLTSSISRTSYFLARVSALENTDSLIHVALFIEKIETFGLFVPLTGGNFNSSGGTGMDNFWLDLRY